MSQFTRYDEFMLKVWKGEVDFETDRFDIALVKDAANSGFSDLSLQYGAANLAAFTGGSGGATGFDMVSGGHEFDDMGYARGTLAGQTVTINVTTHQIEFKATAQTFATLGNSGGTGVGAVLVIWYVDGSEANDVPAWIMPYEKTPSGADLVINWPSTGLLFNRAAA